MVVNIKWFPRLEKKGKKTERFREEMEKNGKDMELFRMEMEKKGEKMEKKGEETERLGEEMEMLGEEIGEEMDWKGGKMEKKEGEMEMLGEEMKKKGGEVEKRIVGSDLEAVAEPITNDLEFAKLGNLCKKLGVDPVQILRRVYLKEVAKIEDIEQRNLSILRCLDKEQQKKVSTELISILKSKLQ